MNTVQKIVIAAGVVLAALRAAFPVKYAGLPGFRFNNGGFPEFMVKADWHATGIHIALIAAATAALFFVFKKK